MSDDQNRVPLVEALCEYRRKVRAPLHVPGHKQGRWVSTEWRELLGSSALSMDLTEAPGLDDLHAPEGAIAEAQMLAARAFGARHSFFLVGGTTAGLHALILTACSPGDRLALPRNMHRSILGAMVLAGVQPVWVRVCLHEELDLAVHLDRRSFDEALSDVAAAVLVHPTYHGVASRLTTEIEAAHVRGIPVLVDEAHGSHFAFHPGLPPSALSLGADGVVQSTHKTGGSLTQSSICHLGSGGRLDEARLREMLRLVQTTSPSYLLMASLDMARRELALEGQRKWDQALELAESLARRLSELRGVRVHRWDDPTRLVMDMRGRGLTGFQASELLWAQGVAVESSGWGYVLAVLSPGDTPETADYVVQAVNSLPYGSGVPPKPPEPPWPEVVFSPRDAFLAPKEAVTLTDAVGRIAAELVAPYPPGIPVVAHGERITPDVAAYLRHAVESGYHLQGPADPALATIRVIKE